MAYDRTMIRSGRAGSARASGLLALLAIVALIGAGEARAENFVVGNTEDAGPGSLRAAIEGANAAPAPPHVVDATGVTGTIGLATALPALSAGVSILGPGAKALTVRRQDGAPPFRIFTIEGVAVTLSDLTISNGSLPTENGGGIAVSGAGSVTIRRSVVSGNTAEIGGGVYLAGTGSSTIERSTIAGNAALYAGGGGDGGGGINNMTALRIDTSTVSGNTTGGSRGAGLVTGGNMLTTIVNSTFADNGGSANIFAGSSGDPTMTVRSTIVADPRSLEEGNCQTGGGATIDSNGYNLADDESCDFEQLTDQENADPLLEALGDNGGPTPTQALRAGSPAVDRGVADGTTTDQRGLPRPFDFAEVANAASGDGADIGAFELHPSPPLPLRPAEPGPTPDGKVRLRIQGGKLLLNRRGKVKIRVTCPRAEQSPPCRGKLTLRTRARLDFGGRKRPVALAASRFSVAAGKTARLLLALPPAKAELLRSEPRALRVLAIARVRDGAGNRATVRKRLRVTLGPVPLP